METRALEGKTAVVTGGGSGIGQAIALAFAAAGCRVAVSGRGAERLRETAARWKGSPPLVWKEADVADPRSVEELFAWARRELGRIDILVNNAGVNIKRRAMHETTAEDWQRILGINATGAFLCMQAVLPEMRQRREGLIVNISSTSGKRASSLGGVAYSASKFAMTALGTCVALEDGKNGIRVTNIYPGEVDTPILDHRPVAVSAEHRARILKPEDVAACVLLVATLPPRAHVPELIVKPTRQEYS
jgi:NAD(P)-dependent dehydrogenase (short-subunit alcohol dehydrogenase family)